MVWDLDKYGSWLTISAVPAYLSLANLGVGTISGNKMTMLMGAGSKQEANRYFQSSQLFTATVILVLSPLIVTLAFIPIDVFGSSDSRIALAILFAAVLVGQIGGLSESIYRATGRYAIGASFAANGRLVEWIGYVCGLFVGGSFTAVALGGLIGRTGIVVISMLASTRRQTTFHWGTKDAGWREIALMMKPSLGVLAITTSSAINLQGLTLLASYFLGPVAVVVFNTHRTLARLAVQVTSTLSHALWPEFSKLFGEAQFRQLKRLYLRSIVFGNAASIFLAASMLVGSNLIFDVWTHGRVQSDFGLLCTFAVYSIIAGALHIPQVLMVATNKHTILGLHFLIISIASILIAFYLVRPLGAEGLVISMVVSETACLILTLLATHRLIGPKHRRRGTRRRGPE